MAEIRLLLTGATGFIGGSVLSGLLGSQNDTIKKLKISALIRREEQAPDLKARGVEPILFSDLDDSEAIRRAAREHDVVINTASGYHVGAAKALVQGLGDRKKETGKEVFFIHTSGTSNLGDYPVTGKYHESRVFSDEEDIYGYEKSREAVDPYPQRTTDVVIIDTAREVGIKTYIIMSPTIYGVGSGFFNKLSIQIPLLTKVAIAQKQSIVIGKGDAVWNHVHIADLADLYVLFAEKLLAGADLPSNEKGIYFSETGEQSWREVSEAVAKAGFALGALNTAEVKSVSVEEAAKLGGFDAQLAELGFASNSRTKCILARKLLGWSPKKTKDDFLATFETEFKIIYEAK